MKAQSASVVHVISGCTFACQFHGSLAVVDQQQYRWTYQNEERKKKVSVGIFTYIHQMLVKQEESTKLYI